MGFLALQGRQLHTPALAHDPHAELLGYVLPAPTSSEQVTSVQGVVVESVNMGDARKRERRGDFCSCGIVDESRTFP